MMIHLCISALQICPNDVKALFRRCQAAEKLEKYEDAYKDAMKLLQLEPKNTAIQPVLRRLAPIIQEKVKRFIFLSELFMKCNKKILVFLWVK